MSFMEIINNKGPSTEPCGTPQLIGNVHDDKLSAICRYFYLFPDGFKKKIDATCTIVLFKCLEQNVFLCHLLISAL